MPGRSHDHCIRCPAKALRWLKDGQWQTRVIGPKECAAPVNLEDLSAAEMKLAAQGRE